MNVSFEALIVSIFGVLPGFLSSAVRATLAPGARSTAGEWIAGSIVTSVVLNGIVLAGFLFAGINLDLAQSMASVAGPIKQMPAKLMLCYLALLYGAAVAWGVASALSLNYAPRVLAHRLRLTPVSPSSTVFNDTLERLVDNAENRRLHGDPAQQLPWLRVRRQNVIVFGRLRRGSLDFAVDKPIEIFLTSVSLRGDLHSGDCSNPEGAESHGVYVRILPTDIVEVLTARADWTAPA